MIRDEESFEPEVDQGQGHHTPPQLPIDKDVTTNPLKNPVVLTRLFEVCELADLGRLRLVSKEWNSLALPRCRREMKLGIYQKPPNSAHQQGRLQWPKIKDELETVNKPFNSIRLHDLKLRSEEQFTESGFGEELKLYIHFWDTFGQCISKLELVDAEIYSTEALKKVIFVDTPNLQELKLTRPNIKKAAAPNTGGEERKLVIVQPNLKCLSVKKMFKTTWQLFFRHFPNIQRLELSEVDSHYHISPLVDTLEELRKKGSHPLLIKGLILDQIDCVGDPGNGVKRLLELPQLKLTSLHIDVLGCEVHELSILPMALRLHGEMLEELRIIDCVNNPESSTAPSYQDMRPYSSFPFQSEPFLALTELHLEYAVSHNLHFLKQFPNLKIFRMIQYLGERMLTETNWEILANVKLIHLEEFKFFVNAQSDYCVDFDILPLYYIPEEVVGRFVKLMPNVKDLSAQVNTPGLRVICQNWKEMRKLELHDTIGLIDDEGLTGIEKGNEERFPNVANLRYLRQLSILGGRNNNIGELSVNKVFLQLPFLHTLNLSLSYAVSEPTYQTLVKQFGNEKISRCSLPPEGVYEDWEGDSSGESEIYSTNSDESESTYSD